MKKVISLMLALVIVISIFTTSTLTAFAAGDTLATATSISTGATYEGSITETSPRDFYKFTINSSGKISINLKAFIYRTNYFLYDENGNELWACTNQYWNGTSEMYSADWSFDLTKGTYYFAVEKREGTGSYNFKISFTSASESFTETLANNSISKADKIALGTKYKGQLAINDNKDIYRFELTSSGKINILLNAKVYRTNYYLYDENGETIWSCTNQYWNGTSELYTLDTNIDLTKGIYYFAVEIREGTGNYDFKISFKSAGESFTETFFGNNQAISEADKISLSTTYKGQLAANDNKDIYKFELTSSGRIKILLNAKVYRTNYFLYDKDGNTVWSCTNQYWNGTSELYTLDSNVDLTKGTYYFAVEIREGTGNYDFKITFTSAKESFAETLYGNNQDIYTASPISTDKTYKGQLSVNDNKDFYKFSVKKDVKVTIKSIATIYRIDYYLYDSNGNTVWSNTGVYADGTSGKSTVTNTLDLSKGTYFFAVSMREGTGNYNFYINHAHNKSSKKVTKATLTTNGKIDYICSYCGKVSSTKTLYAPKTFSLSTTQYTYDGKVKTPSVVVKDSKGNTLKKDVDYTVKYESGRKAPGKYTVVITFKGNYSGEKKVYFNIIPKATSKITATQTTSTITLKWSKVTGADGYRVYKYNTKTKKYETVKTVTTTSLKISKLTAGTKYIYKVKPYTKDDGTIWGVASVAFETATKCATPSITKLTTTKGKANVTWSNVSGESGYQVYYSTKKDGTYKKLATCKADVLKYSKSGLASGKAYYFKVRAYKKTDSGVVYSSWSSVKGIKVK